MDMTLRYVNNRGEVLRFAPESTLHYVDTTMRNWKQGYRVKNRKLQGFLLEPREFTLNAVVNGTLEDRNKLFEVFYYDTACGVPGKLYAGDYYIECNYIASDKSKWHMLDGYMHNKMTFLAANPIWVRDTDFAFLALESGSESGTAFLDYPHDFPYDFAPGSNIQFIESSSFIDAGAVITFEGPVSNPAVTIGGNTYLVNETVGVNERIEIDTINRTIDRIDAVGGRTNIFAKRGGTYRENGGSFVFQPIGSGRSEVTWDGSFSFNVRVREQRSEPRWS